MTWKNMEYCGLDMSNFDCTADEGMELRLKDNEGKEYGNHFAMNFCGIVYYTDGMFVEDVIRFGSHVGTMKASSLEELMEEVNDRYGWD